MANIRKRGDSYQIRVSCGYDKDGNQVTKSMTWKPEPSMTEKQAEKEVQKQAMLFEERCLKGCTVTSVKFEELAEKWFEEYGKPNLRNYTLDGMRKVTKRVYPAIGHLKVDKITSRQIQQFITDLSVNGKSLRDGKTLARKTVVHHRLRPVSIMFSEYYFYLIAYKAEDEEYIPTYFRVDRITDITEHRTKFELDRKYDFDEGELRRKILLMFPGKLRKIRFEFSGPSLQAILDKLPTAVVIDIKGRTALIEAEVYGDGIKMFLLSQGSWVKVIEPDEFVAEFRAELAKMCGKYI